MATEGLSGGTDARRSGRVRAAASSVNRGAAVAVANPFFAYGAVLLVQLHVMWGVWRYRDTTVGDTSYYYLEGLRWEHGLHDNIVNAPLYTDYLGTIAALVHDVATAVLVHRLVLVAAAALLVIAAMRALLGPALGLGAALWWVLVPADFNPDYEVHLFGLLPILAAVLVLSRRPTVLRRGIALALLLVDAALVRPELLLVVGVLALALLGAEVHVWRRGRRRSVSTYVRGFAMPLAVALLAIGGVYARSYNRGAAAWQGFHAKHDLNMCQVYAFSYEQRHPAFTASPWTDCSPLMQRTFGQPMPSFLAEWRANPGAMASFVGWNLRLLPAGLEAALFGAVAGHEDPGYFPVQTGAAWARAFGVLVLLVIVAGLALMSRAIRGWVGRAVDEQRWSALLLFALAVLSLGIALTQRPRPEYLYGLTVGLMALTCLCFFAIVRRFALDKFLPLAVLGAAVLLVLGAPAYYHSGPRPLYDALQRLRPVDDLLGHSTTSMVTSGYNWEICAYTAPRADEHCQSVTTAAIDASAHGAGGVPRALRAAHADVVYADPLTQADPAWQHFLATPSRFGWAQVTAGTGPDGRWSVLARARDVAARQQPTLGIAIPSGLNDPTLAYYAGIYRDGWLARRAVVVLGGGGAGTLVVRAQVLRPAQPEKVEISVDGRRVLARRVRTGEVVLRAPVPAAPQPRKVVLQWTRAAAISPTDPRLSPGRLNAIRIEPRRD